MNKPGLQEEYIHRGRRSRTASRPLFVLVIVACTVLSLNTLFRPGQVAITSATAPALLTFQSMIGNSGPYVGSAGSIRGIPAGGAPWAISAATGSLLTTGELSVHVRGLIVVGSNNPVPRFNAIVSCQSISSGGAADVVNVSTPSFPATVAGNSTISATVALPSPCFAPLVFVGASGSWFAVTGH